MDRRYRTGVAFITILATVLAAACQRSAAPPAPAATSATPAAPPASVVSTAASDAFAVEVSLSAAAQARLTQGKESIIVSADYLGSPTAAAQAQNVPGSHDPWFSVYRKQIELPGAAGTAQFPAVTLDPAKLAWIDTPDAPQVNINVYSGRKSSPDNLLACDMFQDTLAVAARAPVKIACRLIGKDG